MAERSQDGYCIDCPVAEIISYDLKHYWSDTLPEGPDDTSVIIEAMPADPSEAEIADAAYAFSMSDREVMRNGVSSEDLHGIEQTAMDCLKQLGGCALEGSCPGKRPIGDNRYGCQAEGSAIVYERYMMAYERHIMGV